ncbi:Mitochondrial transcription termination factor family protein [Abeliophyllum distichum]|uniref:Mitochondrial transcription termination factor family protein n=1 Tax=Abeliophyllum distichum TaxID=126358 RepID=A0ABD1Q5X4_9LAMI
MILHKCKRFVLLSSKNPSFFYKPHFSFSFSLIFFSSSTKNQATNDLTVIDYLLHKHQFSPETASQVASVLPRVKNLQKSDSILLFLKKSGFSKTQLEKVVKSRPGVLSASLDNTIKPKIKIFQDLGFPANDIAEIISNDPVVLYRSADNRVTPSLSVLKSLLGSSAEVAKVLKISGWFLKNDLEKTMVPNIKFMKSCGVGMEQIIKHIYNFPRFLLNSLDNMEKFVKTVDEMGASRNSKMFIYAVRVVSSMSDENWELKLKLFRDLGFSEDEILVMFRKAPQVFAVSARKLKKVMEVLLATGKYDISCIVNCPASFICSVEKKLEPRMQVLTILDSRNLIEKWPSLATIIKMSDIKFFEKFVNPFLNEVGEVYMANGELTVKRNRKLTRPD